MEPRVIDNNVKQEKEKAMERFNRFHIVAKLCQFLPVLALISCSTALTGGCLVHLISSYLLNHHVVFLIGNSIIVLLFMLFRQSDTTAGDTYDEYIAAAAGQLQPDLPPPAESDGEKQIVVRAEAEAGQLQHDALPPPVERQIVVQEAEAIPPCDDVAVAIEKAKRLIRRFQRTQSEKLKREISVRRCRPELRRSETENHHREEVPEIETLSNEEFRRRVDAFIDKHWSAKGTKTNEFTEYENYALLKMS